MCVCNPNIRTPWCGRGACVEPERVQGNLLPAPKLIFQGRWVYVVQTATPPGRTTAVYEVITREDATVIAEIRWYAPFRRYSLLPKAETVWEVTCLGEMCAVLTQLMDQHKWREAYAPP